MKNKNIFSGIGWSFIERFSTQIIALIISIILARLLAPEDYGLLAMVNVFVAIGDALVAGGFGMALVQKKTANDLDFNSICWLSIALSLLLYLCLYFSAPYIGAFYEEKELILITRILGIRLIFSAINSVQQAYVQKYMLFKKNFIVSAISVVISGLLCVFLALNGAGVWALVIQNILLVIISTVLLFGVIEWKLKFVCSKKSISNLWKYGSSVFLATTVDTIKDNIRTLIVGKIFSSSELAFYNQGKRFPQLLVNDIVNSVGKVLLPVFSEQQEDYCKNKDLMRLTIRISSYILLPMLFGLIGIADQFVLVFLTEKWLPCVPYMRILSLVYITRSVNTILKNSLLAVGRSDINLFHEIVTSVVTVVLIFVAAIWFKSVQLIAWSYVFVSLLGSIIFAHFTKKEYCYGYKEMLSDYCPSFFLSILMCILTYFIGKIHMYLSIKLALQIIIAIIFYIGCSVLFRMEEYYCLLRYIRIKLLRRK